MQETKLWGGRFKKELTDDAKKLSYSLDFDKRLALYDIQINKAHSKALAKVGLLSQNDIDTLLNTLDSLANEFKHNPELLLGVDEDIHSCIERLVTERCGDLGKRMHTGKSRNDQVITDVRLFTKDALLRLIQAAQELISVLVLKAEEFETVAFPGFTHFQPAQPILLSHHILAYVHKFFRDIKRFEQALHTSDVCPLGSGAMAGNNYGLDRSFIAKELGFSAISENSMDAVSDRDFILETLAATSMCMTHLSRFCEEIIVFTSPITGFFNLEDDVTTGSSLMPQKKNPDVAELIRGKMGRVLGHFVALQTTLKGLPLTYNRDLQEDKIYLFDAVDTCELSLICFKQMIAGLSINQKAIETALTKGYLTATDFADYLVRQNIPFREAHEITGKVVLKAMELGVQLHELSLDTFKAFSSKIEASVYDAITVEAAILAKNVPGGTAPNQVQEQLKEIKRRLIWNKH